MLPVLIVYGVQATGSVPVQMVSLRIEWACSQDLGGYAAAGFCCRILHAGEPRVGDTAHLLHRRCGVHPFTARVGAYRCGSSLRAWLGLSEIHVCFVPMLGC